MLKSISIQSFKAISSPVTIPLKPFNVVIGRNGSGKSSAIEALTWLSACVSEGALRATQPFRRIEDLINRGANEFRLSLEFDPEDLSVGSIVRYEVKVSRGYDGKPAITSETLRHGSETSLKDRITTDESGRKYELSLSGQVTQKERDLLRKRARGNKSDEPLENLLFILDNLEGQQFAPSADADKPLIGIVDPKADRGGILLREALEGLVTLRLSPRAIGEFSDPDFDSVSKKLLDEEGLGVAKLLATLDGDSRDILVEKVSFITGRTNGFTVHEPAGPADRRYFGFEETIGQSLSQIPSWMLSEGTRRVTAILALLLHDTPPPILCIEEIENGLDPWTIQFLLEELSNASLDRTQIIVTTHSPYLLNLIPIECITLVDRKNDGVEFTSGESIKELSQIFGQMGAGDVYTARYFHDKAKEARK